MVCMSIGHDYFQQKNTRVVVVVVVACLCVLWCVICYSCMLHFVVFGDEEGCCSVWVVLVFFTVEKVMFCRMGGLFV